MKFTIKNDEIYSLNDSESVNFPKYTSQLVNWANQNAQGTRPKVVGQLSDLFPEFMDDEDNINETNWRKWYLEKYPSAIEEATTRIFAQVENLKDAIQLVDRDLVRRWVEDLVITKTFNGLYVQKVILAALALKTGEKYRLATPDEEAKGIDGFVGNTAYSIKPMTYKTMDRLSEVITVKMIYYDKKKTGLAVEVED
jgi:hypothetical protein